MGRFRPRSRLTADTLREQIKSRLDGTYLDGVGKMLLRLMEGTRGDDGTWNSEQAQAALLCVQYILDRLPSEQGLRFAFDAHMIKAISFAWGQAPQRLSNAIVPTYGDEWRLDRKEIYPGPNEGLVHVIEFLVIRGKNRDDDLDLTEYAWMVHELLHSLLYKHQDVSVQAIGDQLEQPLRDLMVGGIADRGHARTLKRQQTEQVARFWKPTANHYNWAHELVIDVLSLAASGLAYVRNFLVETDDSNIEPFKLDQSHPPFAVRCQALQTAAEQLGWTELADELGERHRIWMRDSAFGTVDNNFLAAADQTLVAAGVQAALDLLRHLHLPTYTQAQLQTAANKVTGNEVPAFGVEMLLAAWYAYETFDAGTFRKWMSATVKRAVEEASDGNAADFV